MRAGHTLRCASNYGPAPCDCAPAQWPPPQYDPTTAEEMIAMWKAQAAQDINVLPPDDPPRPRRSTRTEPQPGYEQLAAVHDRALEQAQSGKGKERHAAEGEAFHDQKIVQLCEWMDSTHGAVFQAAKKAIESTRLPPDRAEAELLGAINYLAAAVLVLRRKLP